MSEVAAPAPDGSATATVAPTGEVALHTLRVRIEPTGPAAERGVAAVCAGGAVVRDPDAELGAPAAIGICGSGAAAVELLVRAATLALDDTDLHITLQRT